MVHLAREAVRRKPFGHRIRVDERPIDLLGRRTQHAVKPDGVCRHYLLLSLGRSSRCKDDLGVMALLPNAHAQRPAQYGVRLVTRPSCAGPLQPLVGWLTAIGARRPCNSSTGHRIFVPDTALLCV